MKRSALVIGASRGIGRQIAITLANNSYRVAVAAKTTMETDQLPGTIHSVLKELQGDRDRGHIAIEVSKG
jgi:citronellol/citronellal dehydrogenase